MAAEMKKYKLGDLIDVSRGKSLAGEFYATSGNLVRLTMGNFDYINNCFKQNTSKDNLFFSGKVEEKFILNAGDIITPLTEQTPGLLGSTARIPESGKYIQSQDVALVRCKKDKLDDGFAYYLISSESVKKQLGAAAQQTKIRHTSPDKIKDCTVYIPEISIQKKIGNILSTLDKRIENLRAQNRVLEQTAKTIYDYTFLQCVNHQTTYNKILNRNIPSAWEVKKIADILDKTPPSTKIESKFYQNNGFYPIIDQSTNFIAGYTDDETAAIRKLPAVFFGDHTRIVKMVNFVFARGSDGTQILYSKETRVGPYYLYFTIKNMKLPNMGYARHFKFLKEMPVAIPDEKTSKKFEEDVSMIFEKILVNQKLIDTLVSQRNTLLPLLMTGQIEV